MKLIPAVMLYRLKSYKCAAWKKSILSNPNQIHFVTNNFKMAAIHSHWLSFHGNLLWGRFLVECVTHFEYHSGSPLWRATNRNWKADKLAVGPLYYTRAEQLVQIDSAAVGLCVWTYLHTFNTHWYGVYCVWKHICIFWTHIDMDMFSEANKMLKNGIISPAPQKLVQYWAHSLFGRLVYFSLWPLFKPTDPLRDTWQTHIYYFRNCRHRLI